MKTSAVLAAALALAPTLAFAQAAAPARMATPAQVGDTSKGRALVDQKGMTLYTFDRDTAGKSACNGPCAQNWPPLVAGPEAAPATDYAVVVREDGARQWAYKGKPLYTWSKDAKAGDATGDGFNGVWHVAQP